MSHLGFAHAVAKALPEMRFTPAKIGTRNVRQLVQQPFEFSILSETRRVGVVDPAPIAVTIQVGRLVM